MRLFTLLFALTIGFPVYASYREAVDQAMKTPNNQLVVEGAIAEVVKSIPQDSTEPSDAADLLCEIWGREGLEQFKRAILLKIAALNTPFTIPFFRDALNSENIYLRRLAIQLTPSSHWLSADEAITERLKSISETSRFRREKNDAQVALEARAERKTPLLSALHRYRDQVPEPTGNVEDLSLAIYKAALNSLSFSDASFGIATGWIDAFGKVQAKPALLWENGELVLQLMESIFESGTSLRSWLAYELFENSQEKISNWAGQRAFDNSVIERIFDLANHFPMASRDGHFPANYADNRINLIFRTINHEKKNETAEQSEAVVHNVREHLGKLPRDLQNIALHALGGSRREAALPYLLKLVDSEERDFLLREAALIGLKLFADRPEVLERARTIGKNFANDGDRFVSYQAMSLLGRHFIEIKRLGKDPNPLALEIAREIWNTDISILRQQLIQSLSVAHYLAVEDFYVEALNSSNFELQTEIMERIVRSGLRDSKKLELAMVNLSQSAQYEKQRQIVKRYLQNLDTARAQAASCASIVAHVEGHNNDYFKTNPKSPR